MTHPVVMKNANLTWGTPGIDKKVLDNITFTVKKGSLVAVIGSIGKVFLCKILKPNHLNYICKVP